MPQSRKECQASRINGVEVVANTAGGGGGGLFEAWDNTYNNGDSLAQLCLVSCTNCVLGGNSAT